MSIYAGVGGVAREVAGGGGLRPKLVKSGNFTSSASYNIAYSFKLNTVYLLVVDNYCYPPFVFESSSDVLNLVDITTLGTSDAALNENDVTCKISGISFSDRYKAREIRLYEL